VGAGAGAAEGESWKGLGGRMGPFCRVMGTVVGISSTSVVDDERRKEGFSTRPVAAEESVAALLT
jgi:hypothetical protein